MNKVCNSINRSGILALKQKGQIRST